MKFSHFWFCLLLIFLGVFDSQIKAHTKCLKSVKKIVINQELEKFDGLLFGPEWTFTNDLMILASAKNKSAVVNTQNQRIFKEWLSLISKNKKYRFEILKDPRYKTELLRVYDKEGWWVQISRDPGVIEVQSKPSTIETFQKKAPFIKEVVFDQAKKFGLKPHEHEGSGHIHLAFSYFKSYKHFRNFLVDLFNHDFIFSQILVENPRAGATPLSAMPIEFQQRLSKVLRDVDALTIPDHLKMFQLANKIQSEVYTDTIGLGINLNEAYKYQAINLSRIADEQVNFLDKTIELRGIRPQKNFNEFLLELEIFQKRAIYIGNIDTLLTYDEVNLMGGMWPWMAQEKYIQFLSDIGLKKKSYITLGTPKKSHLP